MPINTDPLPLAFAFSVTSSIIFSYIDRSSFSCADQLYYHPCSFTTESTSVHPRKPQLSAPGMASNITLQQYHKRVQLWCLFQLTQIDHNYPYISYHPIKMTHGIVVGGEKANLSNPRIHNPDYFPYISEESKQHPHEVLEQDFDADNVAHEDKESEDPSNAYIDLSYHLSSQASRMLMIESSAWGYKATLDNPKVLEETKEQAKEQAKEQLEQMGGMKQ
jgi:hypothetical protein